MMLSWTDWGLLVGLCVWSWFMAGLGESAGKHIVYKEMLDRERDINEKLLSNLK